MGKKRGNQTYYYLVESARVGGKPRIVDQQYLGTAEEVMARMSGAPAGSLERTQHKKFGDPAGVWGILGRLKVIEAIDEVCGPRRADAGASVGTYLAMATLNRVVEPCSKLGLAHWSGTTAGPRFTKVPVAATDHRRFWDAHPPLTSTNTIQARDSQETPARTPPSAPRRTRRVDAGSCALTRASGRCRSHGRRSTRPPRHAAG